MRILAIYRHYWPDATPYARLLKAILEEQVREGHEVEVFCGQPGYNDVAVPRQPASTTLHGVTVRRAALLPERKHWRLVRLLNAGLFLLQAIVHAVLGQRPDLIVANTHPPVLIGLALRILRRLTGAEFILHAQDIHPEGALLAGDLRPTPLAALARLSDTKSCNAALRVVTLSEDMRETLLRRKTYRGENIVVLNNFAIERPASALGLATEVEEDGKFRVLFAGNLGRFQALERIIDAVRLVSERVPLELTFLGAGGKREQLKRQAADLGTRVRFVPYQSPERAVALMEQAHLAVVSLERGVFRIAYPSKTMTYLAAGCPLFAIVERESQLAAETLEHHLGYVPAATSPEAIAQSLELAWSDRRRWSPGERARLAVRGEALFGRTQALRAWSELFHTCARELAGESRVNLADCVSTQPPSGLNPSFLSNPPRIMKPFSFQPVIIIGAARSGTNMVRDLLTQIPHVATWPCDEINYVWRHGQANFSTDELSPESVTPRIRNYIRGRFADLAARRDAHWVVEKTCANSLRVDFVREILPEAKYVFLVRNGLDVAASAHKRWHAPLDWGYVLKKAWQVPATDLPYYAARYLSHRAQRFTSQERRLPTWGPRFAGIDDWAQIHSNFATCLEQWRVSVERASHALASLPPSQVYFLRYEDFVAGPKHQLKTMLDALGISCKSGARKELAAQVSDRRIGAGSLEAELRSAAAMVQETLARIDAQWVRTAPARCHAGSLKLAALESWLVFSPTCERTEECDLLTQRAKFWKRTFDLTAALVGLAICGLPLLAAVVIARLDTGQSGIFQQVRVGRGGRLFNVYKLRTMRNLPGVVTHITCEHDPRITRWGSFFRQTKLDELPQLVNVLRGEMSLVGPRPDVPEVARRLAAEAPLVLTVRPGITGPASLKYRREEAILAAFADPEWVNTTVVFPDKMRINTAYVRDYHWQADLKYLWQTLSDSGPRAALADVSKLIAQQKRAA